MAARLRVRARIASSIRTDQQSTSMDVIKADDRPSSPFSFCVFLAVYKFKNTQKSTFGARERRGEEENSAERRRRARRSERFLRKISLVAKKRC